MKIRKIEPSVGILGKILNIFSNSDKDTYSCDYLNNNDTYSTDEIKTNKRWIDGKPIYRTVIYYENISTSEVHIIPNYIKNIDEIIKFESLFYQSTHKQYEGPYYVSESDFFRCVLRLQDNKFAMRRGSGNSDTNKVKIILEYTKTTD